MSHTDFQARIFINLAREYQQEPHRFAGISKIEEWLQDIHEFESFRKTLRELERKWYNQKSMPQIQTETGIQLRNNI